MCHKNVIIVFSETALYEIVHTITVIFVLFFRDLCHMFVNEEKFLTLRKTVNSKYSAANTGLLKHKRVSYTMKQAAYCLQLCSFHCSQFFHFTYHMTTTHLLYCSKLNKLG